MCSSDLLLGFPTASLQTLRIGGMEVNAPVEVTDHAPNGVVAGDAMLASAEAGRIFCDYIVERTVSLVRELQAAPRQSPRMQSSR